MAKKKKMKVGEKVTHNSGEKKTREDIVKVEETPPPAIVEDDIVTIRGGKGGVTRMKRSEYNAMMKKGGKS